MVTSTRNYGSGSMVAGTAFLGIPNTVRHFHLKSYLVEDEYQNEQNEDSATGGQHDDPPGDRRRFVLDCLHARRHLVIRHVRCDTTRQMSGFTRSSEISRHFRGMRMYLLVTLPFYCNLGGRLCT